MKKGAALSEFYTLNSCGMINAFIENMERINVNTGAKEGLSSGDETAIGKVLFPKSGVGRPWWGGIDVMVARLAVPPLPDLTPPAPAPSYTPSGGWIPWSPDAPGKFPMYPRPDIDPGFHPGVPSPGTPIWGADMMSAGYNDPNYGLPADAGGSFIGVGEMTKCIMPLPIMPATPPGGLFGPDAFVPFWCSPGYDTPPDITFPNLGDGLVPINTGLPTMGLAPLPSEAWDEINSILADPGLGGAVGERPSIGWGALSGIGKERLISFSDIIGRLESKYGPLTFMYMSIGGGGAGGGGAVDPNDLAGMIRKGYIGYSRKDQRFFYTAAGAHVVAQVNARVRSQRESNRIKNIGRSKEEQLQERLSRAIVIEQTNAEFNKSFSNAWNKGAYPGWKFAADICAGIAFLAALALDIIEIGAWLGIGSLARIAGRKTARAVARGKIIRFPRTAEEMDELLGMYGRRIPDFLETPGRNRVDWQLGDMLVTYEEHPYFGPPWAHVEPHWRVKIRKRKWRFWPGDKWRFY